MFVIEFLSTYVQNEIFYCNCYLQIKKKDVLLKMSISIMTPKPVDKVQSLQYWSLFYSFYSYNTITKVNKSNFKTTTLHYTPANNYKERMDSLVRVNTSKKMFFSPENMQESIVRMAYGGIAFLYLTPPITSLERCPSVAFLSPFCNSTRINKEPNGQTHRQTQRLKQKQKQ